MRVTLTTPLPARDEPRSGASDPRPALPSEDPRRHHSAIFHRRLTAQEPLRGHRVVAARLSKVP